MGNLVNLGEDGIIYDIMEGDQPAEAVSENNAQVASFVNKLKAEGKPALVLVDLSKVGKQDTASRVAAKEFITEIEFDRLAAFGANMLIKQLVNLVIFASGQGQRVRYFDSKDEALVWLKNG